jgi:hypothetical protein
VPLFVSKSEEDLKGDGRQGEEGFRPEFVHVCSETIRSTHIDGRARRKVAGEIGCVGCVGCVGCSGCIGCIRCIR